MASGQSQVLSNHIFHLLASLAKMLILKTPVTPWNILSYFTKGKSKATPIRGCGGLWGCDMSRLPYFLYNRFTNGD
jgi:hypothetical protein